jgi:tRNA threonylcarbamoyladenosine biosynthesis protein TsaB
MRALALDTTTRAGSVAVVDDARIVEERAGDASRPHAERLPAEVTAILSDHGLGVHDVDVFAVASGPGSFTGLRIGIATIQGLAFVTGRPVVAVSALEALAEIGSRGAAAGSFVGAWIDAHRRDIFSALYRVGRGEAYAIDRLVEAESPAVGDPAAVRARWDTIVGDAPLTVVGDATSPVAVPLLAGTIGLMAIVRARHGQTITAAGIQPLYVRRPDAEVARDQKNGH